MRERASASLLEDKKTAAPAKRGLTIKTAAAALGALHLQQ
jgi:hypothetical protein